MTTLLILALLIGCPLVGNGLVMMFIGNLHHDVTATIPALGFWPTFGLMLPLYVLTTLFGGAASSK